MEMDLSSFGLPTGFGSTSTKAQSQKKKQDKKDLDFRLNTTKRNGNGSESEDASKKGLEKKNSKEGKSDPEVNGGKGKDEEAEEEEEIGPPLPPSHQGAQEGLSASTLKSNNDAGSGSGSGKKKKLWEEEDDDDDMGSEEEEEMELPLTHEILMKDHTKAVSALSVDPSGARIVSGGYDYDIKLWDFGGMDSSFKPFRSWEPCGNYLIHGATWSHTGDSFLIASGTWQAKLFDRDGQEISEYTKGDMYLRDLRHTNGHVAELTGVQWNPKDPHTFITSSADSTVRIWDANNKRKSKSVIVVKSKERGTRTKITSATYNHDGRQIAAAGLDGALHVWSTNGSLGRPNHSIEKAHERNTTTSSIIYSVDGHSIYTRGENEVKLWDTRSFKSSVCTTTQPLPSIHSETNLCFSPDEKYILTGTAGVAPPSALAQMSEEEREREIKGSVGGKGRLVMLGKKDLTLEKTVGISEAGVVKTVWHPRINQIVTGSSDGSIHVLYSAKTSLRGALMCLTRAPKTRSPEDVFDHLTAPIYTPNALPMFKDAQGVMVREDGRGAGMIGFGKRKREKERMDPVKSRRPEPPLAGPGKGGRVGASATQHVVRGLIRDTTRDEDPREALIRYAEENKSAENPLFTKAWEKTQPKPVWDTTEEPEEEGEK